MVSMKDIAKKCGVSVATVSKALNGYSDIGKEKREEIKRCAEEMGYFPNSSARALKTNRTWNLGILITDNLHSGLTHSYFAAILDAIKVTAERRGYDIDFTSPEIIELVKSPLPIVTIDYVFDGRTAIVSNNQKGMRELTEYVFSMGHRQIAYIHGDDNTVTKERLASFYRTAEAYGVTVPDKWVLPSRYRDVGMTERRTRELLSQDSLPTCIFFPDDFSAVGGMNAIRSAGLRIPEDISVCGYDGIPIAFAMYPRLTTLRQDTATVGKIAAEKLISLIENPKIALIEKISVDGELVKGDTVRRMQPS